VSGFREEPRSKILVKGNAHKFDKGSGERLHVYSRPQGLIQDDPRETFFGGEGHSGWEVEFEDHRRQGWGR